MGRVVRFFRRAGVPVALLGAFLALAGCASDAELDTLLDQALNHHLLIISTDTKVVLHNYWIQGYRKCKSELKKKSIQGKIHTLISSTLWRPSAWPTRTRLQEELAHQPSPPEICQALRIISSK